MDLEVSQDFATQGVLCVNCTFAEGSGAMGCHIVAADLSQDDGVMTTFNVSTLGGVAVGCVSGLRNGSYRISAVEIDAEGVIGTQVISQLFQIVDIEENIYTNHSCNATSTTDGESICAYLNCNEFTVASDSKLING